MDYYKYEVTCQPDLSEILIAFFSEAPFDTFEEIETGFNAYLPVNLDSDSVEQTIQNLKQGFDFEVKRHYIKSQNWNEKWESNFQPIRVGDFCGIRADFHPHFENVEHEITINPKMAFGTGHHATTYLVIELMKDMNFENSKVLDYGCGTGILAILASKLGATALDAVDIEDPSFENTIENCKINNVKNVEAYLGTLGKIVSEDYDFILANINRNVILQSLKSLRKKLNPGGILVISGFIAEDRALMTEACEKEGFHVQIIKERNNWLCFKLK